MSVKARHLGAELEVEAGAERAPPMLLHLPIVMLATLSPVAVSDQMPKFNIGNECNLEGGCHKRSAAFLPF